MFYSKYHFLLVCLFFYLVGPLLLLIMNINMQLFNHLWTKLIQDPPLVYFVRYWKRHLITLFFRPIQNFSWSWKTCLTPAAFIIESFALLQLIPIPLLHLLIVMFLRGPFLSHCCSQYTRFLFTTSSNGVWHPCLCGWPYSFSSPATPAG